MKPNYEAQAIEKKWYDHWLKKNYFHSEPDEREPYSIVIPPPNVTGVLHMGHMLNNTIQDILIRKARLEGKNACWVPGTDHASIATEAKVVKKLRAQGIKKSDLSREEFLEHAFAWKDEYGGKILTQLQKLGASCDWERTRFTMEPKLSKAVLKVFVDLHRKGRVYRGKRMTNWDPVALTVLSNEEVLYKDENSKLHYVRYQIEDSEEFVTIATVRPETILGDSAIAVNPKDERFTHLVGKRAIVPLVNRPIPIIADRYVEMDFGTGCLKVTPAHDMNDYEIGQRHNLEVIDVLTDDRKMSEAAQFYVGEDAYKARKLIVADLEEKGHIVKIEDYQNKVGRSERTNAVVEPRLTLQWYLGMKDFAKTALHSVESGQVKFYPEHFWNMFHSWLKEDNVRDWCISRQLWWGQRIPAWYYEDHVFVAETAEEAIAEARIKTGKANLQLADLRQDEDVLDTWFSSWLWPISVFDGFENQEELKYYYPTNTLVTGWDIMFFWVARMIMSGYEYSGELLGLDHVLKNGRQPFNAVYFTGMVRDNKRRKMSKSLGNSPDALELIDNYGADGVRFGMLSSAAAGNDIIFDAPIDPKTKQALSESQLCEQGSKFCNKMWNALKLLKGFELIDDYADDATKANNELAIKWLDNRFQMTLKTLEANFEEYRLSDAVMNLRSFIWDDFCSLFLEWIKPEYDRAANKSLPLDRATYEATIGYFEKFMTVLHPFMPFVTEEIWHLLRERAEGEDCIISTYPKAGDYDQKLLTSIETIRDVLTKIKDARNKNQVSPHEPLPLFIQNGKNAKALYSQAGIPELLNKLGVLAEMTFTDSEPDSAINFVSGTEKYYVVIEKEIDVEAERERITKELERQRGFLKGVEKKLSNERFVNNAPAVVVDKERKKMADSQLRIKALEESLQQLG
ncbi:MAG: valine--tRNA ligase [Saprospiraceae bacterium]